MAIDYGERKPIPKKPPLQFKRGTAKAFKTSNPILLKGEPGFESDTCKLKVGDGETRWNNLPYIGDHSKPIDGKSAYELWLEMGHTGTVEDFLESLIGEPGKSTYEIWLSLGNEGTVVDFINSIQGGKGEDGKSAYDIWIEEGHTGTVSDFLDSLKGKSAYQTWLDLGHTGSEADFIESLRGAEGKSAYQSWLDTGHTGTEEEFLGWMTTSSWDNF